jgi:hypothetical protein
MVFDFATKAKKRADYELKEGNVTKEKEHPNTNKNCQTPNSPFSFKLQSE